jgi:hypothetical protein
MNRAFPFNLAIPSGVALLALSPALHAAPVDKAAYLEPWKEGELHIHHINTGKGESTFFQLPDGTTMLVDAGLHDREMNENCAKAVPSDERSPGEWIARYIQSIFKDQPAKLDYTVLTHFDEDHIGSILPGVKPAPKGDYLLTGVTEVLELVPSAKIIDRAYPGYEYPKPLVADHIVNYRRFVEFQTKEKGVVAERFQAGRSDQIKLVNRPGAYPQFKIQNLACNGDVWTGNGTETRAYFPSLESLGGKSLPSENACSLAFKLSYGKFDYFNGGDMVGVIVGKMPAWFDLETPVAKVTGPVETLVLNHHGYRDSQNEFFLKTLAPRVNIILSWDDHHPHVDAFPRMVSEQTYPGPRDFFITNLVDKAREYLGEELANQFKSTQGHIVVCVAPDGESYRVYVLNDQSEDRFIKAGFGPYPCN